MPQRVETIVYTISELDDAAREAARNWYREGIDSDWHEPVIDDFCEVCSILGVQLKTNARSLHGGGARSEPSVWFRGFWSQGDGACFEGSYSHAPRAHHRIRAYAPQDVALHRIAEALAAIQRRNFFQLRAAIMHRGQYCHSFSITISVSRDSPVGQETTDDAEEAVAEAMRDLADWLYRQLEREYEDQTSDAVVDEMIAANGYTFTAAGRRFG